MSIENPQEQIDVIETTSQRKQNIVERTHTEALSGESFEDAAEALKSVEDLQRFRKQLSGVPFGSFHEAVEEITNIGRAGLDREEKEKRMDDLARAMEKKVNRMSPRVADLYLGIISEIKGEVYEPKYEMKLKYSRLKANWPKSAECSAVG